jgi:hypothetical protein
MSIKRLTHYELATYKVGEAILKEIRAGNHDAKTLKHIEAVFGWVRKHTPREEHHWVSLFIGYFIDEPFDGEVPSIMGHSRLYQKTDPELPGLEESARPEPSRPSRRRKPKEGHDPR